MAILIWSVGRRRYEIPEQTVAGRDKSADYKGGNLGVTSGFLSGL